MLMVMMGKKGGNPKFGGATSPDKQRRLSLEFACLYQDDVVDRSNTEDQEAARASPFALVQVQNRHIVSLFSC